MNVLIGRDYYASPERRLLMHTLRLAASPFAVVGTVAAAATVSVVNHYNPFFVQPRLLPEAYDDILKTKDVPDILSDSSNYVRVLKIRTMPSDTPVAVSNNRCRHPDATRFGQILRTSGVDELPQILQFDAVGARPQIPASLEETMQVLSPRDQKKWLEARSILPLGVVDLYAVQTYASTGPSDAEFRALCDIEQAFNGSLIKDCKIAVKAGMLALRIVSRMRQQHDTLY